ncbi:MAG: GTPase HflX [Candidatus Omnitrophota bacterium]|nr:GTPase HflX [Candidatus Omnitrophota bacterium]MBU1929813.1 GTPase HflX [Candidatus Omnitrophota bacterium]MBU2035185.1 GTPase HflX [Candidatus Omnitrophota bacterium]MBU2221341.1 GTPase HflX [Candidatus Omnitrophota bacterium]
MEKVLLVTVDLESDKERWPVDEVAMELEELTSACGVEIIDNVMCPREKPTPDLYIGKGKAEEIAFLSQEQEIDTVIFSHDLSGTQQRNLEEVIGKKTIDRTQLILDIFSRHAKSPEGKMQVELAQLQYLMPRLAGKGIILSRLGGGIGTRGPGEQKLEVDRRRIRKRIEGLKENLKHLSIHRLTTRKKREENSVPSAALVGYTNAGKSTLLNSLTDAGQTVHDGLFTTLDPLSKSLKLPSGGNIVVSDTVGFLHKLPHHLVEAFKATLEEVKQADLLIHVIDIAHSQVYQHHQAVMQVLKDLGAAEIPIVTVLNKIDLLEDLAWLERQKEDFVKPVAISAKLKQNLDILLKEIEKSFSGRMALFDITIPHKRMDLVDLFYRQGKVKEIKYLQKGIKIKVNLPKVLYQRIARDTSIVTN